MSSPMDRKKTIIRMLSMGRAFAAMAWRSWLLLMTSPARKAP